MKRKLLFAVASLMMLMLFTGCGDYSSIEAQLREVEIENRLPEVPEKEITTMEEAVEAVYEQQLAACEMLSDSYNQTHYLNYTENVQGNTKRIAEICNAKRQSINEDIKEIYQDNVYEIMENVDDCPNVDAFVEKTYANVLTFYDEYNNYNTAENKEIAITEILTYYYDRTNALAKTFIIKNEEEVFESAVNVIEGNAQTDEDFRFYINKNNIIIKALNELFGGVPAGYAGRVEAASDKLAVNLLNSLSSLSERERGLLMDELGLSTPTPSPKPTATPKPSATPKPAATPMPVASPTPPAATPTPTPKPTPTPTPKPTSAPQAKPTATPKPAEGNGGSTDVPEDTSVPQNPTYILE